MEEKEVLKQESQVEENGGDKRAQWGNQMEFFFTCVAYAVGLGNVWRFPYLAYKSGGGAFLIPYTIMLAFVGMPFFFMEISIGQYASLTPLNIWKVSPLFRGLGVAAMFVEWSIGLYYTVVISYCIYYLFASFTTELPWVTCNNTWNTPDCIDNISVPHENHSFTPSEEYFYNKVLNISSGIDEVGGFQLELVGTLALAWILVFLALIKGVGSLGKVVYFVALFPYVMLTTLLIRGLTLDGAKDGVIYYLEPQWEELGDFIVWRDAAVQIFYSLSCCTGGLIAMSSFNKFNHNTNRDAILIPIINCATSIYAGLAVFATLGFMALEKNTTVDLVAEQGPGLVFVVYPEALANMPVAPMWSILFFFMMIILGFGSQFTIMEAIMSALLDQFHGIRDSTLRSIIFRFCCCAFGFLIGLPMVTRAGQYIVTLVDESVGGLPLIIIGIAEVVAINWVYGFYKFAEDIEMMIGKKPSIYWHICWRYIAPAMLLVVFIMSCVQYEPIQYHTPTAEGGVYIYPDWCVAFEWVIVSLPLLAIIGAFFYIYCSRGGWEALKKAKEPDWDWGPAETRALFKRANESKPIIRTISQELAMINNISTDMAPNGTPQGIDNESFKDDEKKKTSFF